MFKKIALAAALTATASFATWDYYTVPTDHKGDVKAAFDYDFDGDWSAWALGVSARYVVIPKLELSIQGLSYGSWENDCGKGCSTDGSGIRDFNVGVRYQLFSDAAIFADVKLPIGDEKEGSYIGSNEVAVYFGTQQVSKFATNFIVGAELGFDWGFEHDNWERGLDFKGGLELGYNIASVGLTPFLGLSFVDRLTESECKSKGCPDPDDSRDGNIAFWIGASYAIVTNFTISAQFKIQSGDDTMGGDAKQFEVTGDFAF